MIIRAAHNIGMAQRWVTWLNEHTTSHQFWGVFIVFAPNPPETFPKLPAPIYREDWFDCLISGKKSGINLQRTAHNESYHTCAKTHAVYDNSAVRAVVRYYLFTSIDGQKPKPVPHYRIDFGWGYLQAYEWKCQIKFGNIYLLIRYLI